MVTRINSNLYYELLLNNNNDIETIEIIQKLQKYTRQLEEIVFPPPKDPLVQTWIKEGMIK